MSPPGKRPPRRTQACCLAGLVLCLMPGCESVTQRRLKEISDRYTQAIEQINRQADENAASLAKEREEGEARAKRAQLYNHAAERLASGDAKGALDLVVVALSPVIVQREVARPANGQAGGKPADSSTQPGGEGTEAVASGPETKEGEQKDGAKPEGKDRKQHEDVLKEPPGMTPDERARLLTLKGMALGDLGRKEEAQQAYLQALESDPENQLATRNLGRVHFEAQRFRQAMDAWKPLLARGARDGDLLFLVGQARYQLARSEGRPEELHAARLSFEQVLIEHPEDVEVVRWLATLAYETGRYGEAVAYLQTARAQSPFEAADLERLGNCYLALGDSTRAMDYLDLAAQMRPPSPELAKTLGDLHVQARFPGRGAEWLARAYQQNPAQAPPEERFRIGVLFADGGRDEEAAAWLTAIGEAEPHHAESQARLVLIHQAAGREDDALAAHEQVRRLPGAFGLAHAAAGALYLKRKQLEPAADAYSRAAGLPESKVAGLVGLAEVSYARGNLEGALDYYRQALKFHPGDARLNAAVEQVAKEASIQGAKALSPTGSSGGQ